MSRQVNSWSLKKTLARKTGHRPIDVEDLKYIWAAYKKGGLSSMGDAFAGGEMDPEAFNDAFSEELESSYYGAWTLFAEVKGRAKPVGFALVFSSHPNPEKALFAIIGDMVWFPWASPRNKVESAVRWINDMRKDVPLVEYASLEHKPFFEVMAKHAIMRRVGTSFNVHPDEPTAIFETRKL